MRSFSPAVDAALATRNIQIARLVTVFFTFGTVRKTDYPTPLTYSTILYESDGLLLDVPTFGESSDAPITTGSLALSNVNTGLAALVKADNQLHKSVRIDNVLVDVDNQTVLGAVNSRSIFISSVTHRESAETDMVVLGLSNHMVDFESTRGRTSSYQSQLKYAAGKSPAVIDTSMRHTQELIKDVPWGR